MGRRADTRGFRRLRLVARPELLALIAIAVAIAVFSAGSQPAKADIELTAGGGSLTLSNSREGAAILSLAPMRPGDTVTGTVTIGNTGTVAGDLALSASNLVDTPGPRGGALSATLDLLARDVTDPFDPATVYSGTIPALGTVNLGSLAAGASRDYEFRVLFPDTGGGDNVYQGSSMSVQFDWAATAPDGGDTDPPRVVSSTPADGALVASAGSLVVVASEDIAAIRNATIDGAPAPAPSVSGATITYAVGFADGPHTLAGELEDLAGNRKPIRIHFTVWSLAAADYPYVEMNWPATRATTLAATNGAAEVAAPAEGWSGGVGGDWLVLRVDPRPAGPVGNGFEPSGDVLDVTAYWALAGGEVHSFAQPLDILMRNGAATAVPKTLENGVWREIAEVPSGQALPADWQDGFYRAGTDVHVLTRHLSSFGLLRDAQGPTVPGSFRGARKNGRLRLSWVHASDNSGRLDAYVVYANGRIIRTLHGGARAVDLGRVRPSDARKFRLAARDAAGNTGAKTYKLVLVPSLHNVTFAAAKTRLKARELRLGKVTRVTSTTVPAGRVVKAGRSGVVRTGTIVALTVSLGSSGTSSTGSTGGGGGGGRETTTGGSPAPSPGTVAPSPGTVPPAFPPLPSDPVPTAPAPSPTAGETGPEGAGVAEPSLSVIPTSSESGGSLRRALGLALISAAFLAAFGAWWRLRPSWPRANHPTEIVFWDQRLARGALAAIRRIAGRA